MNQFKQRTKTQAPSKTPMANKIIDFDEVKQMRIAVYDNATEGKPYVCEVDFHFDTPQAAWGNVTTLKLRNNLYKLNNIAYKMPTGHEDFQPFYERAIEECRAFKKHTGADFHNKLGKRYPDRYYTIPGVMVSYDPVTKSGQLQITLPVINKYNDVDVEENYQCIDFEMQENNGKNLDWTWIG